MVGAVLLVVGGVVGLVVAAGEEDADDRQASAPARGRSFLGRLLPREEGRGTAAARLPPRIAAAARRLPLERKVAQLLLVGFRGTDLTAPVFEQLRELDLGGVVIEAHNYESGEQLSSLAGEARVIAEQERHLRPWVMTTQEGGEFSAFPDLPPAKAPADLASVGEARAEAAASATALGELGVNGVLGPVVDVGTAAGGAIGLRAFSDDPELVARYATATVRAYERARVLSAAKHFPGLGAGSLPTDEGPATVGLGPSDLRGRDLIPFRAAFDAGAPAVVLSHALYTAVDAVTPGSLSKPIVTDLLRRDLGFSGLAITDDLAAPAVTAVTSVRQAAVEAIAAGADMVYISGPRADQEAAYDDLIAAVRRGKLPIARIDEAVGRILAAKRRYRLLS